VGRQALDLLAAGKLPDDVLAELLTDDQRATSGNWRSST